MALAGLDSLGRDLIMVYDVSDYQNNNTALFTKQISDFPIKRLRFVDRSNPGLLVSCGKSNICFWQVKNKFLLIQPVNLNEHSHNNMFNQIEVLKQKMVVKKEKEKEDQSKNSRLCYFVHVVSSQGCLYVIDHSKAEMKSVLRLHAVDEVHKELDKRRLRVPLSQFHRYWWG